jgi:hypothetical protein
MIPFADGEELARKCGSKLFEVGGYLRLVDPEPLTATLKISERAL